MTSIAFMRGRFVAAAISGILLLATVVSLATQQLNWGLDFTGGTLIELNYEQSADLGDIRTELASSGFEGAMVVSFGTDRDVLVRLPISYSDAEGARMVDVLRQPCPYGTAPFMMPPLSSPVGTAPASSKTIQAEPTFFALPKTNTADQQVTSSCLEYPVAEAIQLQDVSQQALLQCWTGPGNMGHSQSSAQARKVKPR